MPRSPNFDLMTDWISTNYLHVSINSIFEFKPTTIWPLKVVIRTLLNNLIKLRDLGSPEQSLSLPWRRISNQPHCLEPESHRSAWAGRTRPRRRSSSARPLGSAAPTRARFCKTLADQSPFWSWHTYLSCKLWRCTSPRGLLKEKIWPGISLVVFLVL